MIEHTFHVFGAHPGGGNSALVIQHDHSDTATRQQRASGQHASACVYIDRDGTSGRIVLDYFYPHTRSPLCLHATLAAARALFDQNAGASSIDVRTAVRGQPLSLLHLAGDLFVRLARQAAPQVAIGSALPAALLNAPALALVSAPVVASVGSPKLLLEVADSATLTALAPDLARIAAWGGEHGVSGCYVYCRLADGCYQGRNFNHLDPAREDSATGVAAGALSLHLGRALTLLQGEGQGRPCRIETRLDGDDVLVGGMVETVV